MKTTKWLHNNMWSIDGLSQDCSNPIANTLELMRHCAKQSIYDWSVSMLSPSRRREIMHHWNSWMSFVPAIGNRSFQLTNKCPVTSEPFIKLTNHSYKSHTVIWSWNTDKVIKKLTSKICAANATTDETNLRLVRFHRLSWPRAQVVHFSITTKRVLDDFYGLHPDCVLF